MHPCSATAQVPCALIFDTSLTPTQRLLMTTIIAAADPASGMLETTTNWLAQIAGVSEDAVARFNAFLTRSVQPWVSFVKVRNGRRWGSRYAVLSATANSTPKQTGVHNGTGSATANSTPTTAVGHGQLHSEEEPTGRERTPVYTDEAVCSRRVVGINLSSGRLFQSPRTSEEILMNVVNKKIRRSTVFEERSDENTLMRLTKKSQQEDDTMRTFGISETLRSDPYDGVPDDVRPFLVEFDTMRGRSRPKATTKAFAEDIRAIKRLLRGDVFTNSTKRLLATKLLAEKGIQQPCSDLLDAWRVSLRRAADAGFELGYAHEFVHTEYNRSGSLLALSPWLHFLNTRAMEAAEEPFDAEIANDMRDKLTRLFRCPHGLDPAMERGVRSYSLKAREFLNSNRNHFNTDITGVGLNREVLDAWKAILGDGIYTLTPGHLNSAALFQRMLPGRLMQSLDMRRAKEPSVKTRALTPEEIARYCSR